MKIGALRGLLVLVPAALAADGSRAAGDTFSMLSPAGTPPSPRIGHSIALDAPDDRAIVFGGGTILLDQLPVFVPTSDLSALSLTPGAESWTALSLPSPPPVRMFHTAVFDPIRDRMLVYGGLGQNYQTRGDLWELTLATGSEAWRLMAPTGSSPSARFAQSAVYVPPLDSMIVYGGYASLFLGPTNDLFVLSLAVGDGDWTQEPAGGGPGSGAHQMAFDPVAQRVLLFGIGDIVGQTSSNDLYARSLPFATTSWVKLQPPAPLPTSRQGFGAAFDASSFPGQPRWLVLSGGILDLATSATGEYAGDGYVLDATPGAERWDALVPSTSISRTAMWPAVHDVAGNRIILFGGRDGQGDQNAVYALGLGTSYAPRLASVSPAGGDAGQSVEVTLQGSGTAWTAGASIASFGPEITVNRVTVLSPTQIVASITIQAGALDGTRNVGVLTGSVGDTAIDAFTVKRRPRNVLVGSGLADPNPNTGLVFDAYGSAQETAVTPYAAGHWGLNVGAGEVDGDGFDEVLSGPGPGPTLGPQVRAFERDSTAIGKINYFAYGTLKFGCGVAAGATDGDAFDEIVTGAGAGLVFGPHVRGWDFDATAIRAIAKVNFFAYATLKYGVVHAAADLERDGYDEIVTAPGPGSSFGPQVRGFNVDGGAVSAMKINFFAFTGVSYGANVAGGDVDADDFAEILVAKGPGSTGSYDSAVLGFDYDGAAIAAVPGLSFVAFPPALHYGARVGAGSIFLRFGDEILVGGGPDPAATADVREYAYDAAAPSTVLLAQIATFPSQTYGVNVATAALGF